VNKAIKINRSLTKSISNKTLKNHVFNLTKGGSTTFNAVRNEMATGLATKGKYHTQKLIETRSGLIKLWRKKKNLNEKDRKILKRVLNEIQSTLSGN